MKNLHALLLVIAALALCMEAAADSWYFKNISGNDGMPSTVRCVLPTDDGCVWVGTNQGLRRYDGKSVTSFRADPNDPKSLPGDEVKQIVIDSKDRLFVVTDKGLALRNPGENGFTALSPKSGTAIFSALCVGDKTYFGSTNSIFSYNPKNGQLETVYKWGSKDNYYNVTQMVMISDSTILCSNRWKGMMAVNPIEGSGRPSRIDCGDEVYSVFFDSKQRLWVLPYNKGLLCFGLDGSLLHAYTSENSGLVSNVILSLCEGEDGRIWIGTDGGGINILDPETGSFELLSQQPGKEGFSLPDNSIICLQSAPGGIIWAGSIRNGLIRINPATMQTFRGLGPGSSESLSNSTVLCLFEKDGVVWIGTDGGGINSYDPQTGVFTHYPSTYGKKIASISDFSGGRLLISLFSEGIFIFDPRKDRREKFQILDPETDASLTLRGKTVNLHREGDKVFFLGEKVYEYDLSGSEFRPLQIQSSLSVTGALIYAGSRNGKTYFNDFRRIYVHEESGDSLGIVWEFGVDTTLSSVSASIEGDFLIGCNIGLFRLSEQRLDKIESPMFTAINSVLCTGNGQAWLGDDRRIFLYDSASGSIRVFGESDGALENEYLPKARLVCGAGVFMGGTKGLLMVSQTPQESDSPAPELLLSDYRIDSDALQMTLRTAESDILREKLFSFSLSRGTDTLKADNYEGTFTAGNLRPGRYSVTASVSAQNGSFGPQQPILQFRIGRPWYRNAALLAIVILLAAGTWIATRLYVKERRKSLARAADVGKAAVNVTGNNAWNGAANGSANDTDRPELPGQDASINALPGDEAAKAEVLEDPAMAGWTSGDRDFYRKLTALIEKRYDDSGLRVEDICKEIGMSKANLYKKMKRLTGTGLNEYLTEFRLKKAAAMLKDDSLSITEISERCGFSNARYFSTIFKQETGKTPSQWRKGNGDYA